MRVSDVASRRSECNEHDTRTANVILGHAVGLTQPVRLILCTFTLRRESHRAEVRTFAIVGDHLP